MRRVILHSDKPNDILAEQPVPVAAEQVREFLALLKKADFWQLETEPTCDKTHNRTDGTQWVLEGVRSREYHVVDRWSPISTDFGRLCVFLMGLFPLDDVKQPASHFR